MTDEDLVGAAQRKTTELNHLLDECANRGITVEVKIRSVSRPKATLNYVYLDKASKTLSVKKTRMAEAD